MGTRIITWAMIVFVVIWFVSVDAYRSNCIRSHYELRKIKGVEMQHFVCDDFKP